VWTAERSTQLGMAVSSMLKGYTTTAAQIITAMLKSVTKFTIQVSKPMHVGCWCCSWSKEALGHMFCHGRCRMHVCHSKQIRQEALLQLQINMSPVAPQDTQRTQLNFNSVAGMQCTPGPDCWFNCICTSCQSVYRTHTAHQTYEAQAFAVSSP
jgi:hypothetical protein